MKYLLDSNFLIYYLSATLTPNALNFMFNALKNRQCAISVISEIEVLGFQFLDIAQEQKAEKLIRSLPVIALTDDIVKKTIEIRKIRKPKVADAIIAATAILNGLTLISRNEKDFKNLPGLNFINPFDL